MKKLLALLIVVVSLCILYGCGSSTVKFVRTNYSYEKSVVLIMHSVKDVTDYKLSVKEKLHDNAFLSADIDMLFCNYNTDYFESHILFVATLVASSGSIKHKVKDIRYGKDKMTVTILTTIPDIGTCDMAEWHLLIEVDRKKFSGKEGEIIVEFEHNNSLPLLS